MCTEDSLAEKEKQNKPVSMYKQPDYRKLLKKDEASFDPVREVQ